MLHGKLVFRTHYVISALRETEEIRLGIYRPWSHEGGRKFLDKNELPFFQKPADLNNLNIPQRNYLFDRSSIRRKSVGHLPV